MIAFERRNKIMEELKSKPIKISDLSIMFDVSEVTIRRDLKFLEDEGFVDTKHGGVAYLIDTRIETTSYQRSNRFREQKMIIAEYAASLVGNEELIFIDAGSTTELMIENLKKKNVSIVTNGFRNIELALRNEMEVRCIGGELKKETLAFVGPEALIFMERYRFDKCFLGTNGLDVNRGITNADINESYIKMKAIEHSREKYILADSSKFGEISHYMFANWNEVKIITEKVDKAYESFDNILIAKK